MPTLRACCAACTGACITTFFYSKRFALPADGGATCQPVRPAVALLLAPVSLAHPGAAGLEFCGDRRQVRVPFLLSCVAPGVLEGGQAGRQHLPPGHVSYCASC